MSLRPSTLARLRVPAPQSNRPALTLSGRRFYPCHRQQTRAFSATQPILAKKYTDEHEWIELDTSGKIGTVGVSTYAAKSLGDVVYVELPQLNQEVSAGDTIGAVESVKSASDILAPVAGKVTEANNALENAPGTINRSPEEDGWIAKIELEDPASLDALMDKDAYDEFTGEPET